MRVVKHWNRKAVDAPSPVRLGQALHNLICWRCPYSKLRGWTTWHLKVPYNTNYSMILSHKTLEKRKGQSEETQPLGSITRSSRSSPLPSTIMQWEKGSLNLLNINPDLWSIWTRTVNFYTNLRLRINAWLFQCKGGYHWGLNNCFQKTILTKIWAPDYIHD